MTWFVLVPGACHDGWWFEPVAQALRVAGHTADAITLTGLDPERPAPDGVNLDTHVQDVLHLLAGRPDHAVLVGHSYAGSVITAVADERSEQVAALLYLDAFVPLDSESCWSMTNDEQRQWYGSGSGKTGLAVDPLPFFDPRARPQPLATLMQKSRLTGRYLEIARKHYVLAAGADWVPHSPFVPVAERLRQDGGWTVTELDSGHNFLANGHQELSQILLQLA